MSDIFNGVTQEVVARRIAWGKQFPQFAKNLCAGWIAAHVRQRIKQPGDELPSDFWCYLAGCVWEAQNATDGRGLTV